MKRHDNETKHPAGAQKKECQPLAPSLLGDGYGPATRLSVNCAYMPSQ